LGTGEAVTWNDLAGALFKALGLSPSIEYFDMPEALKGKYQYFTEADIGKLREANSSHKFFDLHEFTDLDDAVKDYVNYLEQGKYI
jgi:ADP-L-glycero-D-manno-heptose 6-epimerase